MDSREGLTSEVVPVFSDAHGSQTSNQGHDDSSIPHVTQVVEQARDGDGGIGRGGFEFERDRERRDCRSGDLSHTVNR